MEITLRDLYTKYRAAGVYTIYNDDTIAPAVDTSLVTRLVVGFSKIGPFNTPVFIDRGDYETARAIFGPIDKSLERKGSYFHRSLEICLESGPVLALNLLKLQNEEVPESPPMGYVPPTYPADVVPYTPFSCAPSETNGLTTDRLFASYYNKERFWSPDERYLLATRITTHAGFLFNLVNLSQSPVTYLIRKSAINGFDVTVEEWYSGQEIPAFLKKSDFISDYFIDVIVIEGDFGPDRYQQLSTDAIFGSYFNTAGLINTEVDNFLNLREVAVREIFTGCIIPEFTDKRNNPYYIEDIINNNIRRHNILCAVDRDELDKFEFGTNSKTLDLVGHSLIGGNINEVDFLSYKGRIAQDFTYDEKTANSTILLDTTSGYTIDAGTPGKFTITIAAASPNFADVTNNMEVGDYILGETTAAGTAAGVPVANPVLKVTKILKTDSAVTFDVTNGFKANENGFSGSLVDVAVNTNQVTVKYNPSRFLRDATDTFYIADTNAQIYQDYVDGKLTDGDKLVSSGTTYYLKFAVQPATGGIDAADDYRDILVVNLFSDADLTTAIGVGTAPDFGATEDSNGYDITTSTKLNIISVIGDMNVKVDITTSVSDNVVDIPIADTEVTHEDFLVGEDEDGNAILTRIKTIQAVDTTGNDVNDSKRITTYDKITIFTAGNGDKQIERFKSFENYIPTFNLIHQPGFVMAAHHMPDGTNTRVREIYSVMTGTVMRDAVVDPDMINFRYLVDTFNAGLESNSKNYLSLMLSERQTCLGILNTPSKREFELSTNPRFTSEPTAADPLPLFDVKYVDDGGNLSENPSFLYTMPSEADGSSWVGYFFPNITIVDSNKRVHIPPAALVSNAFMRKFASGEPFKVVANRRGILTSTTQQLTSVEYKLTKTDRGFLENKGINPIIQKKDGTIMVFGNQTGFQNFRSVLNNLHVRDLLITLTLDITNILDPYVFEFNDDALRLEVSTLLNNYLGSIQNSFGAIVFFDVIFDRSNNPTEVTRENVGIIDIIVEPVDVATRYINRITLSKAGEPAVGGFTAL